MSNTGPRAPRVTAAAADVVERVGILDNPYLAALRERSMSLDCFRRTQEQFWFAVSFFPRPMAALVGRIPDPRSRLDILHNLVEEHGEFQERSTHDTTFRQFLSSIGCPPGATDELAPWPALRAFNSVLISACVLDELEVGVACMGIIEYAFSSISSVIGAAVVEQGWVPRDRLVHYKLHAEIDERHAEEFFAVVEPSWDDGGRRYFIEQGLGLGAYAFDRLYTDLLSAGAAAPRSRRPASPG